MCVIDIRFGRTFVRVLMGDYIWLVGGGTPWRAGYIKQSVFDVERWAAIRLINYRRCNMRGTLTENAAHGVATAEPRRLRKNQLANKLPRPEPVRIGNRDRLRQPARRFRTTGEGTSFILSRVNANSLGCS